MRLLVTGGAGFIGSYFSENALNQNNEYNFEKVTVVDKLTYAGNLKNLFSLKKNKKFEFIKGDICNSRLTRYLVEKHDVIVNFAAETHVDQSLISSEKFVNTNFLGVSNLLEALKIFSNKKLIQISTDEVYGSILKGSWKETQGLGPRSPYSATKAGADLLIMSFVKSYGINACITRASNNFGPRQHPEKLIPNTIIKALGGENVPVYGTGKNVRDWLYVADHVNGIQKVIFEGKSGQIYHLGGDNELTNIDLVKSILKIINVNNKKIEFIKDRKGHDFRYSISSQKAKKYLGYKPALNFESNLQATVEWYLNNAKWWLPLLTKKHR